MCDYMDLMNSLLTFGQNFFSLGRRYKRNPKNMQNQARMYLNTIPINEMNLHDSNVVNYVRKRCPAVQRLYSSLFSQQLKG